MRELQALLRKVGYVPGDDRLVILGDLIDRGPDPVGVVRFAREQGAQIVLGNHEEKALRWLGYEKRRAEDPSLINPMEPQPEKKPADPPPRRMLAMPILQAAQLLIREERAAKRAAEAAKPKPPEQPKPEKKPRRGIPEERKAEWRGLSEEDVAWLKAAPLWMEIAPNCLGVHAGFEPKPLSEQKRDHVIRIRYLDAAGEMVGYQEDKLEQPPNTVYWTEVWPGPQNVFYGHAVHSRTKPRIDTRETPTGTVTMVGLDTGCCYGGHLTAAILVDGELKEFVQVEAEREYITPPAPIPDEVVR